MLFIQILRNLDELFYEVMSWLLFYPLTLWRTVRHPWRAMADADADADAGEASAARYADRVSPPTFLMLTLLLTHLIEMATVGTNPLIADRHGLAALIDSDTNLLLFRLFAFALFPLVMAARLLRRQRRRIDRETLRPPFHAQCYVTAPMALSFSLAGMLAQTANAGAMVAGAGLAVVAAIAYVVLQAGWFRANLGVSWARATGDAMIGYAEGLVLLFLVVAPFAMT